MSDRAIRSGETTRDRRVIAGWVIAPLIAFVFWGSWTIIAVPFLYPVVLIVGLPIFSLCQRRGWLKWWQALAAGWVAGLVVSAFPLLAFSRDLEIWGPRALVLFQSYGASVALLFWCIAILRNPKFPENATNWPLLLLCVTSLGFALWSSFQRVNVSEVFGQLAGAPALDRVTLVLPDGAVVEAKNQGGELRPDGREVGAYTRGSLLSDQRFYWINGVCRSKGDVARTSCQ